LERNKIELLKKIRLGSLSEGVLTDIYFENRESHIFLFNLVQSPSFQVRLGLEIIPKLFNIELVRVIANKRTNPFLRKKCELEFVERYRKIAIGEKLSLIKIAPESLLAHFVDEKNEKILEIILQSRFCTENLIVRIVNGKTDRQILYGLLSGSKWIKLRSIAEAVSFDSMAPIKIWIEIIPFLPVYRLREIIANVNYHEIIRKNADMRLKRSEKMK